MNDRIPDALWEFAALFNRDEFWESHAVVEAPGRQARSDFLQGLILVASASVHVRRGHHSLSRASKPAVVK
jgi:predicted metal-dependent hydrolase